MATYIEREALIAAYDAAHKGEPGGARKLIEDAPAVDVAPVVHGRWVDNVDENGFLCNKWRKCSACGCLNYSKKPPYCPNCGVGKDGDG